MLHLDTSPSYGSHWRGLSLADFRDWVQTQQEAESLKRSGADASQASQASQAPTLDAKPSVASGICIPIRADSILVYSNVEAEGEWLPSDLQRSSEFIIDLAPKVSARVLTRPALSGVSTVLLSRAGTYSVLFLLLATEQNMSSKLYKTTLLRSSERWRLALDPYL